MRVAGEEVAWATVFRTAKRSSVAACRSAEAVNAAGASRDVVSCNGSRGGARPGRLGVVPAEYRR
jgi:hypothetical protein